MTDPNLELMKAQEENRRLMQRIAQAEQQFRDVTDIAKRVYPPGPHRCVRCRRVTERPRRYLCPGCYMRWYRRQRLRVVT